MRKRDHSLFTSGGVLVLRMGGGGVTQSLVSLKGGGLRKYANRCVRGSPAI